MTGKISNEAIAPEQFIDEIRSLMRTCALPAEPGESVREAIARAAERLGLSASQARRIWYGERATVAAHELEGLRSRAIEAMAMVAADYERTAAGIRQRRADLLRRR